MFSKIMNVFKRKNRENKNGEKEIEGNDKSLNEVWGPTIDYDKCKSCTLCYKFCRNGVYDIENGKVVVKNKSNCVKGCFKCLSVCRYGAISFPNN